MDARSLNVDPADYKISRKLFARLWRLTRPYWAQPGHWRPRLLLFGVLALAPAMTGLMAWTQILTKDMTNALVAKDHAHYTVFFMSTLGVGALYVVAELLMSYWSAVLNVEWRQWLTDYMVSRYLQKRTYYDIALSEDLDNPDQRIQEQIPPFINVIALIPRMLLTQVLQLVTGGVIIASVSRTMMLYVIGYAVIQTLVTLLMYTPLIRLNFDNTVAEADLRYGILHVRENAETVAFYRGEASEQAQIDSRLAKVTRTKLAVLIYQMKTSGVLQALNVIWQAMPFFLIAPLFFQDKIQFGAIAMATVAAGSMLSALTSLGNFIPILTSAAPGAVRLAQILERFDAMDAARTRDDAPTIALARGDTLEISGLSLETPGGEQRLVRDLNLRLTPGQHLIVVGQTGVGKSSLLRAMAGLWQRGSGVLTMPPGEQCMFLPQRPYMILSDLRSQLLYPNMRDDVTDAELQQVLQQVCLPDLLDQHGGMEAVRDWGRVLSLGEQQRIGFARALISRARYVFLDEATSAVDIATEAVLYGLLQAANVTYVSVGHRETILAFHDQALCLYPDGSYRLTSTRELRALGEEVTNPVEAEPPPRTEPPAAEAHASATGTHG